jgi:uncharacterized protein (DUF2141 family)
MKISRTLMALCIAVSVFMGAALIFAQAGQTSAPGTYKITIHMTGFRNEKGKAGTLVFCQPKGWPESNDDACRHGSVPIHNGQATAVYEGFKPGRYAIVALHDENENKKLDRNFLHIPKEGFGFPNGIKVNLTPPSWEAASVNVAGDTTVEIKMQYK